ncbi:MAG: 1-phosphofructokinase family hexose kinase [Bacteroidetes bacterium]|nr:1-phosphofructokinase family hexose kinase [Bacteroidota bacterium]
MHPIVTITFSPCVDKSIIAPFILPDRKIRCESLKSEPGGGGINVARAIKKLGGEALAIFPSGGHTGKLLEHLMLRETISHIAIKALKETREDIMVVDIATKNQYRFVMPGAPLSEDEWKTCLKSLEEIDNVQYVVASGSLPEGVPTDIYARIAKIVKGKKAKFIVDTSGEPLKHAMEENLFLIKPNINELGVIVGKKTITPTEVEEIAKGILSKGKCENIVVSMGANGALLITEDFSEWISPPLVESQSTVGAGDSLVAGIVYYLSIGKTLSKAVRYGVAAGTAATMNQGTELCKLEDTDRIFEQIDRR